VFAKARTQRRRYLVVTRGWQAQAAPDPAEGILQGAVAPSLWSRQMVLPIDRQSKLLERCNGVVCRGAGRTL
jgi:hypothetical protein